MSTSPHTLFGQLYLPGFTLQNDWFTLHHEYVFLQISTVPINGLADCLLRAFTETTISIDGADGPVVFIADKVNIMPYTPYDGMMHYRTISPISLINTQTPDFHTEYLSPTAPNYSDLLLTCLAERLTDPYVQASFPSVSTALTDHPVQLRFVGKHRSRLLEMPDGKGGLKKMRSWHTGLMLNALPAVHELVYCIGLGNHTHLGFGCVSEENSK